MPCGTVPARARSCGDTMTTATLAATASRRVVIPTPLASPPSDLGSSCPHIDPDGPGLFRTQTDYPAYRTSAILLVASLSAVGQRDSQWAGKSGQVGIRTRDAGFPAYRFSKPAPSAARPPVPGDQQQSSHPPPFRSNARIGLAGRPGPHQCPGEITVAMLRAFRCNEPG